MLWINFAEIFHYVCFKQMEVLIKRGWFAVSGIKPEIHLSKNPTIHSSSTGDKYGKQVRRMQLSCIKVLAERAAQ